ncbi:hypothetical protein BH11CYA1_BH11CYA1_21620 [soil metagenome]
MAEKTAVLHSNTDSLTPSTTGGEWAYRSAPTYLRLERQARSQLSIASSCGIWLSYLILSDHCSETAWVILLGCLMLCSLARWLELRRELEFRLAPHLQPSLSKFSADSEIGELDELAAPVIAIISMALPVVLIAPYLNFQIDFDRLQKPAMQRQIVDIELVAPKDTIDRKDILPSNSTKQLVKKHRGALLTVASPLLIGAAVPRSQSYIQPTTERRETTTAKATKKADQKNITETIAENITAATKVDGLPSKPLTFKAPDNWKTIVVSKVQDNTIAFSNNSATVAKDTRAKSAIKASAFLSEVEEANMIESIDNDGQSTALTIQAGGRSASGKGAASDLHSYLKLLNHKIKSHWLPPRGVDRIANIEFRISRDGKLLSTKGLAEDGKSDEEAEAAAILAINRTFPFEPLPAELESAYLDVRYTFNYRLNKLEVMNAVN